ncbi:MAG: hypothetical protein DDG60_06485 [Anaerolineae bacterium]|nr:MAG: hypothetical protein DDG60_06485 [Anaerolineae bacterium]
MKQVTKRYMREFFLSTSAYILLIIVSTQMTSAFVDAPWRGLVAITPVIPAIFMVVAFVRYLNGIDELQQRIQLMAIGFSAGVTGLLTFAYGFLETVGFPHISLIWIFPLLIALWGVGTAYFSRKYQ